MVSIVSMAKPQDGDQHDCRTESERRRGVMTEVGMATAKPEVVLEEQRDEYGACVGTEEALQLILAEHSKIAVFVERVRSWMQCIGKALRSARITPEETGRIVYRAAWLRVRSARAVELDTDLHIVAWITLATDFEGVLEENVKQAALRLVDQANNKPLFTPARLHAARVYCINAFGSGGMP